MSGHSKWSTIKRQKGAADAKRSNLFTKLANAITVAARSGNDPALNFQLRLAIDRAHANNMPTANIERAIARAQGSNAQNIEEILYEAYGPQGVAILIETATDNRNRAIASVKAVLNKFGGKLASAGAVQYLFDKKGEIVMEGKNESDTEMDIIESGADDYEKEDNQYLVITPPAKITDIKKWLEEKGYKIEDAKIVWQAKQTVSLNEEENEKLFKLLSTLDDLDDVTAVASNIGS
jgi:YebC/PmpR family DNA-binding regulatory protein